MYVIFLDDERFPHEAATWCNLPASFFDPTQVVICRNMHDVQHTVAEKGMPEMISFDHDLGDEPETGYDIAKWLCNLDAVNIEAGLFGFRFSDTFQFAVHSKNPIGAKNIKEYMNNYFKHRE